MALILTDSGAEIILKSYFKKTNAVNGTGLFLKLFSNDVTPTDVYTKSSFVESAGGGYAHKELLAANWTVSTVNNIAQAAYAQQIFAFTGPLSTNPNVYGYYIIDADDNLIYAERASFYYVPEANGGYAVTPVFQLSKGTPS